MAGFFYFFHDKYPLIKTDQIITNIYCFTIKIYYLLILIFFTIGCLHEALQAALADNN